MRGARPVGSIAGARAPPHAPSRAHCRAPCTVRGPRAAPRPWEVGGRFGGAASLRISKSRAPGFPETERGVVSFSLISEKTDGPRAGGATGTPGFSICRTGYRASGVETTPAVAARRRRRRRRRGGLLSPPHAAPRHPRPASAATSPQLRVVHATSTPCADTTTASSAPAAPSPPPSGRLHLHLRRHHRHRQLLRLIYGRRRSACTPAGREPVAPRCPPVGAQPNRRARRCRRHLMFTCHLYLYLYPPQVPLSGRPLP